MAEGEGFEPPDLSVYGFQDRRNRPLCHPSRIQGQGKDIMKVDDHQAGKDVGVKRGQGNAARSFAPHSLYGAYDALTPVTGMGLLAPNV